MCMRNMVYWVHQVCGSTLAFPFQVWRGDRYALGRLNACKVMHVLLGIICKTRCNGLRIVRRRARGPIPHWREQYLRSICGRGISARMRLCVSDGSRLGGRAVAAAFFWACHGCHFVGEIRSRNPYCLLSVCNGVSSVKNASSARMADNLPVAPSSIFSSASRTWYTSSRIFRRSGGDIWRRIGWSASFNRLTVTPYLVRNSRTM